MERVMAAAPRICLVGPTHPSANPRLVREAVALARAGYEVVAVTTRLVERLIPHDAALEGRGWENIFVDLTDRSLAGRCRWQFCRVRRKAALAVANRWPTGATVRCACAYAGPELAHLAARQQAALYIAHTHAVLPAACEAAARTGARVAFDAEDLLAECSDEPVRVMRWIEERFVPSCAYVSTMSRAAALHLQQQLGLSQPAVVLHNTPSLAEREGVLPPEQRAPSDRLRIYWFGQTVGRHSCAEQVLRAMALLKKPARLVLRGHADESYIAELRALAAELKLNDALEIHPRALPTEMVKLAAENDVLLGSQPSAELFHQMAVGNKIFTGLMAGLVAAMTDTTAHRLLASELSACAFLFPNNDPRVLATELNRLLDSPGKLAFAKSAAWRLAESRFNWECESAQWLETISKLAGPPRSAK